MKRWLSYARAVGGRVVLDRGFARALWVVPWLAVRARTRRKPARFRIAYHPQPAGPWYTLPLSLIGTGVRQAPLGRADIVMAFDDRTVVDGRPADDLPPDAPRLNARIADISKTHVGDVFQRSFGYPLSVDPRAHAGPMVEKSDGNGVHDGRIVQGPLDEPRPGFAYQRLVDSTVRNGVTDELRCTCVDGRVVAVIRKEKAAAQRFAARYRLTHPVAVDQAFSPAEQDQLARFLDAMGLDIGSIDVLRDHQGDGRLYVVDVNKTCMPVLSMNVADLDRVMADIGDAAEAMIAERIASSRASRPG